MQCGLGWPNPCSDGTYADMLQSQICGAIYAMQDWDILKIKALLADTLTTFYAKHIWPRSEQQRPQIDYLLVVQPLVGDYPTTIHISETAANLPARRRERPLASALIWRITCSKHMLVVTSHSLWVIVRLCAAAVYVAKEVRENITGVGPLERVAIFNRDGTYDELCPVDIMDIEESVSSIGEFLGHFYGEALDGASNDGKHVLSEWSTGISNSLNEWYTKWQSSEWRRRRRSVRASSG